MLPGLTSQPKKAFYIEEQDGGWLYEIRGTTRFNGDYVKENNKEFELLEKIGLAMLGYKIEVRKR